LINSLYYGYSEKLIRENSLYFLYVAQKSENWGLLSFLSEFNRTIYSTNSEEYHSQFIENFEIYFESVINIYGYDRAISLLFFNNEMNNYFEKHGLPKSKLIFPTIYGNYMADRNERATLIKRLKELGLPHYGFHLFRHTHASLMLNSGANWKELQERMGHRSISTTMDTYAELAPQRKLEAVGIYLEKIAELTQ